MSLHKNDFFDEFSNQPDLCKNLEILEGKQYLNWSDLQKIYDDYSKRFNDSEFEQVRNSFCDMLSGCRTIHATRSRVKEPSHIIEKIIRNMAKKYEKYKEISPSNYDKYITDIIGVRVILLFKKDWEIIHDFLLEDCQFIDDDNKYIVRTQKKNGEDFEKYQFETAFDSNDEGFYFAEEPVANIRFGDDLGIYRGRKYNIKVMPNRQYRSVHYVLRYEKHLVELQTRSLFEEGWGEADHKYYYPYYKNRPLLGDYSGMFNRLIGIADEMSAFMKELNDLVCEKNLKSSLHQIVIKMKLF